MPDLSLGDAAREFVTVTVAPSGATVIADGDASSRDSVAAALRFLAQVTSPSQRSIAVIGAFDSEPALALEEHDYIGRLVVRLNIGQLVAVGREARHIQSAAGLEGSWNGESVLVETPEEAYDLLRAEIRENDVVLVTAGKRVRLALLAERLSGAAA